MCRGMHFVFKQVKLLQFDAKQGHTASSFDAKLGKKNSNFAAYLMPNKAGANFKAIAPFHSLVKRANVTTFSDAKCTGIFSSDSS